MSPKAKAICDDKKFFEDIKGTGGIDTAKAEELNRKAKLRYADISFICAGTGDDNERCAA